MILESHKHQWAFAPTVGYFRCAACGEQVDHSDPRFAKMLAEREAKLALIEQMREAREADDQRLFTITRLVKRMRQMKSALQECEAYFEPLATGEWLADGPHGNREMQLLVEVQQALAIADRKPGEAA